jgi:hypothetical protein
MKRINIYALTAVILALALSFAVATPAAPAAASPADHPQIHDALAALRNAKGHLESAKHDFGGHRADAEHAVDEAIHQLEICMKYDK